MIFLMIISFISIWLIVGNSDREPDWRLALVQAVIFWGGYLILGTEIISFFKLITPAALSIMWVLPIITGIIWTWLWLKKGKILRLPIIYHRHSWVGLVLDVFVILILATTAIVAIYAPPNSNEAMVSRMSRVAHWEQNMTLAHYPTGIESQNSNSPGAELIALNFYVLGGNDNAVNMVAWLCFAGSVAAVASMAEVFGASVNGQRIAAIFTASLPAAITQASSMMNDIVVAFWIVSAILMLLHYKKKSQKSIFLVLAAMASALAVLTNSSAFIFLWPFGLLIIVVLRQRLGMFKMVRWALIAVVIMSIINGWHFNRTLQTYAQIHPPLERSEKMNDIRNLRVIISNVARNMALHADLPFIPSDGWLLTKIENLHNFLQLDISDPRTTMVEEFYIPEINTSEMTSGNPVHAVTIVFSVIIVVGMVMFGKKEADVLVYIGVIFASFLMFCYFLKWLPTGARLQLPLFILFSPMLAILLDRLVKQRWASLIGIIMLVFAVPWLFFTEERPVISYTNRTFPNSVFDKDRDYLYFATNLEDYPAYRAITDEINSRGIRVIGLDLNPNSEEYPFWALLNTGDEDLRIEWVATDTTSAKYLHDDFSPGAIICEGCEREDILRYTENYEHLDYGKFDLFIKE